MPKWAHHDDAPRGLEHPQHQRGKLTMSQYRKKPVVIEAVQWHPGVRHPGVFGEGDPCYPPYVITIHEQRAYLSDGDWILPEPKPGHFYPCKPDIFAATYEPVA